MESKVQYAKTSDGVNTAFTTLGEEPVRVYEVRWRE